MPVISDMTGLRRAAISVALLAVAAGIALLRRERLRRRCAVETARQRARLSEERARNWFWETDAQRRITYLSGPFAGLDDLPTAMLVGGKLAEQREGAAGGESDPTLERAAAARLPFAHELQRIKLSDGRVRYWRANGGPVFDEENGAFLGYRGTAADVTDAVLSEAARAEAPSAAVAARSRVS